MSRLTISPSQPAAATQQTDPPSGSGSGSDFGPILQAASVPPAAAPQPKQPQPAPSGHANGTGRDDSAAAAQDRAPAVSARRGAHAGTGAHGSEADAAAVACAAAAAGAANRADVAPDLSHNPLGGCRSGAPAGTTDPAIGASGVSVPDASAVVPQGAGNATGSALQSAVDAKAPRPAELDNAVAGQQSPQQAGVPQLDRVSPSQAARATQSKDARIAATSEEAGTDPRAIPGFTATLVPASATPGGQAAQAAVQALFPEIQPGAARSIEGAQSHAGADATLAAPGDPTATASAGGAFGSVTTTYMPEGRAAVATPVGQPGFGQEFSERVVVLARGGVQSAQISLEPAGLGPVGVSVQVHGHEATLVFTAQHETTRSALEAALPRLREMFAECGMQLSDASVGGRAQPDRSAPDYSPSSSEPLAEGGADRLGGSADPAATARAAAALRLVDTYA